MYRCVCCCFFVLLCFLLAHICQAMSTFEDVTDVTGAADGGGGEAGGGITRNLVEEMVPFLRDPRPEIRCVHCS